VYASVPGRRCCPLSKIYAAIRRLNRELSSLITYKLDHVLFSCRSLSLRVFEADDTLIGVFAADDIAGTWRPI
jgi:hypothetical protein